MRLLPLFFVLVPFLLHAGPIPVWPAGRMPGKVVEREGKPAVTVPDITVYPAGNAPAPAVLICPGGGYGHLALEKEGTEIAKWLNTLGVTGIVLRYRVPDNRDGAFQDIQRAMRVVRAHAAEWKIDPHRLGVMGFSAGGHLSARLSTNSEKPAYEKIDAVDSQTCRPDFVMLVYPAYLDKRDGSGVAEELPITKAVPPTLIVHNEDDTAFVRGSKLYHAALQAAGVPNELVFFQHGGHGYGLRSQDEVKAWPERAKAWLEKIGVRP